MSESTISLSQQKMYREVMKGLCSDKKWLPSKYFYDERGSKLFELITYQDEYYPTRCEISIMEKHIDDISALLGPHIQLVEFGSGSSVKTRLLLEHLPELVSYIPMDISEDYLYETAQHLQADFPELDIHPLAVDYTRPFAIPETSNDYNRRIIYFPGSTLGNFYPDEARKFLATNAKLVQPDGGMLIGIDLKKDRKVLESAYNDSEGITAAFNLNILVHINRKLDADFNLDYFEHYAFYNEEEGRIEMHLTSLRDHIVTVQDTSVFFNEGETIHTENSYKYSMEEFRQLAEPWFTIDTLWMDEDGYFSVQYLTVK